MQLLTLSSTLSRYSYRMCLRMNYILSALIQVSNTIVRDAYYCLIDTGTGGTHICDVMCTDHFFDSVGIVDAVQPQFAALLSAARNRIQQCGCSKRQGCPLCVQCPTCSEYNEVLCKTSALQLLDAILNQTESDVTPEVNTVVRRHDPPHERPPQPVPYHSPVKTQTLDDNQPVPLVPPVSNYIRRL